LEKKKDEKEYFIDRSPSYFEYVMDYLRNQEEISRENLTNLQISQIEREFDYYQLPSPFSTKLKSLSTSQIDEVYNFWGIVQSIVVKKNFILKGFRMNVAPLTNIVNIYLLNGKANSVDKVKRNQGWRLIYSNKNFVRGDKVGNFYEITSNLDEEMKQLNDYSLYFHFQTSNGGDNSFGIGGGGGIVSPGTHNNDGKPYVENEYFGLIRGFNTNSKTEFEGVNSNSFEISGEILYVEK